MRLIDADKLIDYFYYGIDDKPIIDGISDRKIIDIIKNQPTAYSVDEVEIVKHCGTSDAMCEWERYEHSENDNPAEWIICPHNPKRIYSKDIKYCPYCGNKIKVVE